MNRKSIFLAAVLAWSFASTSHATIIRFEAEFAAMPPIPGLITTGLDFLTLDVGDDGTVTDVEDVVSWLGDSGNAVLVPTEVDLLFSNGHLSGSIEGFIAALPFVTIGDFWPVGGQGVGTFFVQLPPFILDGLRVTGTNTIRRVAEPASLALFALGLLGLGMARRRLQ